MTATRRTLVDLFAPHMQRELDVNKGKGDRWCEASTDDLSFEVVYHAAKLHRAQAAQDHDAIRELAADTANAAAMLADKFGQLKLPPPSADLDRDRDYDDEPNGGMRHGSRELKEHVRGLLDGIEDVGR